MQSFNLQTSGSVLPTLVPAHPTYKSAHRRGQPTLPVKASAAVAGNGASTSDGSAVNNRLSFQVNDTFPPAEPEPVSPEIQAIIDEQGLDYETSGLKYLTNEARVSYHLESLPTTLLCTEVNFIGV